MDCVGIANGLLLRAGKRTPEYPHAFVMALGFDPDPSLEPGAIVDGSRVRFDARDTFKRQGELILHAIAAWALCDAGMSVTDNRVTAVVDALLNAVAGPLALGSSIGRLA